MKKLIALLLAVCFVLSLTGCQLFGEKAPLENERPRDRTRYTPEDFKWAVPKGEYTDNSKFMAGKYVRTDGNAVLYIDYEDSKNKFNFELYVKDEDKSEFERTGEAKVDGDTANHYHEGRNINIDFVSDKKGVIKIYAVLDEKFESANGTYYITRAKYDETPTPKIVDEDEDDRPANATTTGTSEAGDTTEPIGGTDKPDTAGTPHTSPPDPPVNTSGTPEQALRALILSMQGYDYSNNEIKNAYATKAIYDEVMDYYCDDYYFYYVFGDILWTIEDYAYEHAYDFWFDGQDGDTFAGLYFGAVLDLLRCLQYKVTGTEYSNAGDEAIIYVTVTQKMNYDFGGCYDLLDEVYYSNTNYFDSLSDLDFYNYFGVELLEILHEPRSYGLIDTRSQQYEIYAWYADGYGWIIDSYDLWLVADMMGVYI
ncbi:MAG: hypothetical protein FWD34_02515 [Oscillospiraceae bacterium]|nr:hypothetical protein [Oscillospiraceae bacterium]